MVGIPGMNTFPVSSAPHRLFRFRLLSDESETKQQIRGVGQVLNINKLIAWVDQPTPMTTLTRTVRAAIQSSKLAI